MDSRQASERLAKAATVAERWAVLEEFRGASAYEFAVAHGYAPVEAADFSFRVNDNKRRRTVSRATLAGVQQAASRYLNRTRPLPRSRAREPHRAAPRPRGRRTRRCNRSSSRSSSHSDSGPHDPDSGDPDSRRGWAH